MTKGEQLIEEAKRRFKEQDALYSMPHADASLLLWGNKGEKTAKRGDEYIGAPSTTRLHESFNFSIHGFFYNEKDDVLSNWGRGLGILYYKGEWASKSPYPKITETYQIY